MINVPSTSGTVFNFDTVSAALESSGTMANSQLYGAVYPSTPSQEDQLVDIESESYGAHYDNNAVHLKIGNSLGAGATMSCPGGRPPLPPSQRTLSYSMSSSSGVGVSPSSIGYGIGASGSNSGSNNSVGNNSVAESNWANFTTSEGAYEPLFLASSETVATPQHQSVPQAPNTGLLRRRSEHRRSGRREHGRRAASVGPSIAPRQQQVY